MMRNYFGWSKIVAWRNINKIDPEHHEPWSVERQAPMPANNMHTCIGEFIVYQEAVSKQHVTVGLAFMNGSYEFLQNLNLVVVTSHMWLIYFSCDFITCGTRGQFLCFHIKCMILCC